MSSLLEPRRFFEKRWDILSQAKGEVNLWKALLQWSPTFPHPSLHNAPSHLISFANPSLFVRFPLADSQAMRNWELIHIWRKDRVRIGGSRRNVKSKIRTVNENEMRTANRLSGSLKWDIVSQAYTARLAEWRTNARIHSEAGKITNESNLEGILIDQWRTKISMLAYLGPFAFEWNSIMFKRILHGQWQCIWRPSWQIVASTRHLHIAQCWQILNSQALRRCSSQIWERIVTSLTSWMFSDSDTPSPGFQLSYVNPYCKQHMYRIKVSGSSLIFSHPREMTESSILIVNFFRTLWSYPSSIEMVFPRSEMHHSAVWRSIGLQKSPLTFHLFTTGNIESLMTSQQKSVKQ
jgi:hypothetical protein